jgi:amino acid transporter
MANDRQLTEQPQHQQVTLASNALGLGHATLIGLAYAGLALSTYFILPFAQQANGPAVPLVVLATAVALAPTAVSVYALAQRRPSAGAAYSWAWHGLNPVVGIWVGYTLLGFYGLTNMLLQPLIGGETFNSLLNYFGVSAGYGTAVLGSLIFTVIAGLLVIRNVRLSARAVGILMAIEVACVVLFLGYVIIYQGVHGHLSAAPFTSAGIINGGSGFKAALIFTIFALAAVDAPATVAEETRTPKRLIPRMTALVLLIGTVFFVFASYGLAVAVSQTKMDKLVTAPVQAGPVYLIAAQYIGGLKIVVVLTMATAVLALFVGVIIFPARVTYALSREGLLPEWFGRLHPKHQTPRNAQLFWVAFAFVLPILGSLWQGHSVSAAYAWGGGLFTGFVLLIYVVINLANIGFHIRSAEVKFNWWLHGIIPAAGVAVSGWLWWEAFWGTYSNVGFKTGGSILLAVFGWIGISLVAAVITRQVRKAKINPADVAQMVVPVTPPQVGTAEPD